ncbi:conserved exported hypothetical protein [Hyphomicrobiales bacterium]|nr:conserved exported hypothetical protein [Hyphomicrobiales bacterium]CAH1699676.1 conserved exported hypothetical protein [Hyphomicrobiales bacterium]CAI0343407.1 DUF305 domain-containing protein [Hyphomicrobiales bacterium]
MNRTAIALAALLAVAPLTGAALAQQHHNHGTSAPAKTESASTKAYRDANTKMHKDMDIAYSGDADADFVRGMIPHHQGAIDMARIVLAHGKDPEIRKLAESVIRDQEKEVAMMQDWLKKNGK